MGLNILPKLQLTTEQFDKPQASFMQVASLFTPPIQLTSTGNNLLRKLGLRSQSETTLDHLINFLAGAQVKSVDEAYFEANCIHYQGRDRRTLLTSLKFWLQVKGESTCPILA